MSSSELACTCACEARKPEGIIKQQGFGVAVLGFVLFALLFCSAAGVTLSSTLSCTKAVLKNELLPFQFHTGPRNLFLCPV